MLKIDCLVINTQLEQDLRDAVVILANERAGNKKDASLMSVYNDLRQAGIEIDLRSVGHIYANQLDLNDKNFTPMDEVEEIVGAKFEKTVRNLVLMQDKTGENQISDQAPGQAVAQGIAQAFYNANATDTRTQSVLKTLQDAMAKGAKRLLGELPSTSTAAKEDFTKIVRRALDLETTGYRDLNGSVNNIRTLFEDVRNEVKEITSRMDEADEFQQDQWDEYVTNLENASYALLFSKAEARKVVTDAMKQAGFAKTTAAGVEVLDWNRMAGGIKDVSQIRANVDNALREAGFDQNARDAVKTSLEKEYHELFGEVLRKAAAVPSSNTMKTGKKIETIVANALSFAKKGYSLAMTNTEAKAAVRDAMTQLGYIKTDAGGKTSLDWTEISRDFKSEADVQAAVEKVLADKGFSPTAIASVNPFVADIYKQFAQEISDHAAKELATREARIGAEKKEQKDDFTRLSELNALGIFSRQHDAVLNRMLGVSDLRDQDIAHIENLSNLASELYRELDKKDYQGRYVFQNIEREINTILSRNIANKTRALKIVSAIGQVLQAMNMGRIANAWNLLQNNFSGFFGTMTTNLRVAKQMGLGYAFRDNELFRRVFADVARGGVSYGDDIGRFSNQQKIDDIYRNYDLKARDPKGVMKNILTAAFRVGRAGLNGSDAAFKSIIHKKNMMLGFHRRLVELGYSKQAANEFLNEALYGKSIADVQDQAEMLLDKAGIKKTKASIMRTSNDLIIGNLNTDGALTDIEIQGILEGTFMVSSYELGHEAQSENFLSKSFQAGKQKAAQTDAQLVRDQNWSALWSHRLGANALFGIISPFVSGKLNWAQLTLENTGLGIATGLYGKWREKGTVDYTSKDSIRDMYAQSENNNQKIYRGVMGLMYTATAGALYLAGSALRGAAPDPEKDKGLFGAIEDNPFAKKAFLRVAPNAMLMAYSLKTEKNNTLGLIKYGTQAFNYGSDFDVDVQYNKAMVAAARGDTRRAVGTLASIAGSKMEFPLWRSYKGMLKLVTWNAKSDFKPAYTMWEGLLGGNMLEDVGIFQRDSPIEALPGVGPKAAEQMRAAGINDMSDLKSHPEWKSMLHSDKERERAQKAYEELYGGEKDQNAGKEESGKTDGSGSGTSW